MHSLTSIFSLIALFYIYLKKLDYFSSKYGNFPKSRFDAFERFYSSFEQQSHAELYMHSRFNKFNFYSKMILQ